jgi:hypothetical protein
MVEMVDEYQSGSSIELCSTERQLQLQRRCRRRRPQQEYLSTEYSCTHSRSSHRLTLPRLLLFICSVLLRQQVAVVDASSSSSLGIPLRIPAATQAFRGGGSDATGPEEEGEQDKEEEQEKEQERPRKLWPVDNLFRLNDDVKSEAASVMNTSVPLKDEELYDPLLELPPTKTNKKEGPRNNSRGGALTMVKAPKPKTRRFAGWLAPLDTSRVAPSSSRLLQDEEDQVEQAPAVAVANDTAAAMTSATASENATVADIKTASAEMTSFNQIWWGNVWDQQLPDGDEQVEVESANDLTLDKVLEEPEPSPVQEPERKRPSQRKPKRRASRDSSAADAKSKQDAEALPIVEKDMIDDGSLAEETIRIEQEIEEEAQIRPALTAQPIHTTDTTQSPAGDASPSPFVSSGYVSGE